MQPRTLSVLALLLLAGLLIAACAQPPLIQVDPPAQGAVATMPAPSSPPTDAAPTEAADSATPDEGQEGAEQEAPAGAAAGEADTAGAVAGEADTAGAAADEADIAEDATGEAGPNPLAVNPERPGFTVDGSPTLGDPNAPIVILDFSDFQ